MQQWHFVAAAYAVVLIGTLGVVVASFAAMRRAECRADALTARR